MRYLIVCCDGTWQNAEQAIPTNVRRLEQAVAKTTDDGIEQVAMHFPGVGAGNSIVGNVLGGVAGVGLSRNVMDAYRWLIGEYSTGDRISLFGSSRGAFTARSLAGMISACGLVDPAELDEDELAPLVERLSQERYRAGKNARSSWRNGLRFRYDHDNEKDIPVWFIGVWDTVGSLGVPEANAEGKLEHPHECIAIGAAAGYQPKRSGYLCAFADDSWGFCHNNDNIVRLTVTRT